MSSQSENLLDDFASVKWATSAITSGWAVNGRRRHTPAEATNVADIFCRETLTSNRGILKWVETYKKPEPGSTLVTKSISLFEIGPGLLGFAGICHGGATMAMMDEALGYNMVANETERMGGEWGTKGGNWVELLKEGKPLLEVLDGYMLTAKLNITFLKPVLCPSFIGVEVDIIEHKENSIRMVGIMKDENGMPLMKAEGKWIRLNRAAKL